VKAVSVALSICFVFAPVGNAFAQDAGADTPPVDVGTTPPPVDNPPPQDTPPLDFSIPGVDSSGGASTNDTSSDSNITIHLHNKMKPINQEPIFADFGNADEDGAIRLITDGTSADVERLGIKFEDGQQIWLTDNDIEVIGTLKFRDGMWVTIPDPEGFKDVPKDAPYHINNIDRHD
jgi:hypothetical protein